VAVCLSIATLVPKAEQGGILTNVKVLPMGIGATLAIEVSYAFVKNEKSSQ
jgi:hypothetical protein